MSTDLNATETGARDALRAAAITLNSARAGYIGMTQIVVSCGLARTEDATAALTALRAMPGCQRTEQADGEAGTFVRAYFGRTVGEHATWMTFDAGSDTYEGRVDEHGNQVCNDCGTPMFYCRIDEGYHHVQQPGSDPVEPCFLIQEQAWPVPAPQPGEHGYELADGQWTCIRHEETCPPLNLAVLTRATAYPAPPEPETCFCGGKVRYGRCRECGTLYGDSTAQGGE